MFNPIILVADTNMTNITNNFLRWMFQPYIQTLGQFAYPIFFILLVGIMWTSIPSNKVIVPAVFMIILGFLGYSLFDIQYALLFQFVGIAAVAWIFYVGFIKKGEVF